MYIAHRFMVTVYKVGTMIRALCDRRYVCTDEWYEVADCADSRPHVNAQTEYGNKKKAERSSA